MINSLEGKIEILNNWIQKSKNIVFFGGAGVSTESGIPDFRSEDGLYHQQYRYPPETILSHSFFMDNPEEFYHFYKVKMNALQYKPNIVHEKLSELEKAGKLSTIITQNIDGLHQKAGSKVVYELHGSIYRNHCMKCHTSYDANSVFNSSSIVPCCSCGGIIKPDVVLYEEALDEDILESSISAISKADILIIGGTSLSVYPANALIRYYYGNKLIVINKTPTYMDIHANLFIQEKLGNVFSHIVLKE